MTIAERADKRMEIGEIGLPDRVIMEQVESCYHLDFPNCKFEVVRDLNDLSGEPTIKELVSRFTILEELQSRMSLMQT